MIKKIIIPIAITMVLAVPVYAQFTHKEEPVTKPTEKQSTVSTKKSEPVAPTQEAIVPVADQPVIQQADVTPVAAPVAPVRSFEEIIKDYPNLSGTPELVKYSLFIRDSFPDKFTNDVREKNIKLLSVVFVNSAAATGGGRMTTNLLADTGQGDFWQRFANRL